MLRACLEVSRTHVTVIARNTVIFTRDIIATAIQLKLHTTHTYNAPAGSSLIHYGGVLLARLKERERDAIDQEFVRV